MNRLTEKQLLILTVGITILLTGGLGFLIWSDLQDVGEEEQKISGLRDQIDAAQGEIDQIESREYRVIANREISDKEVAFLPNQTEIENFWDVVERFAEESGVRISGILSKAADRRKRRKKTSIQSVPQVLELTCSTEEFLRFLNLLENYDRLISVVEWNLSRGDMPDEDGKIRHRVQMSLATFTYSRTVANTIVSITNYEKKKEHPEVKKWLSRIKIQERETYTLRTSVGRRDPFVNVRRKPDVKMNNDGPDPAQQEAVLQTLIEDIRSLQEGLMIEEHLQKIGDLFRLNQQRKANRADFGRLRGRIADVRSLKLITAKDLLERFRREVLDPFAKLEERLNQGRLEARKLTKEQVKEWFDRIAKHFDDRDWKKVMEEVKSFADMSKGGKHVEDEVREMAHDILQFEHRAKVIQGFEKRRVRISTILYSPTGMSVAIINGKTLGEGDALDNAGQVLIQEIGENYIIFETEGVEIKKTQGR